MTRRTVAIWTTLALQMCKTPCLVLGDVRLKMLKTLSKECFPTSWGLGLQHDATVSHGSQRGSQQCVRDRFTASLLKWHISFSGKQVQIHQYTHHGLSHCFKYAAYIISLEPFWAYCLPLISHRAYHAVRCTFCSSKLKTAVCCRETNYRGNQ